MFTLVPLVTFKLPLMFVVPLKLVVPVKFAVPLTVRSLVVTLFTLILRAKAMVTFRPLCVISMLSPAVKVTSLFVAFTFTTLEPDAIPVPVAFVVNSQPAFAAFNAWFAVAFAVFAVVLAAFAVALAVFAVVFAAFAVEFAAKAVLLATFAVLFAAFAVLLAA